MLSQSTGLQTHIWNNNFKAMTLLALYPVMIIGIVWLCAFVLGAMGFSSTTYGNAQNSIDIALPMANSLIYQYWPMILCGVVIWFVIAWFFHTRMIRKLSHSHPVTRKEEPELYNLLENLSIAAGIPAPRLEIIETHARNAFASGIDQNSYTVTVTRGLMQSLTKDEIEAVLAHELMHIMNKDVRLLIITIIFTGMIGFAAQMVWSQIRYGFIFSGNRRNKGGGVLIMIALAVILWLGYMITLCTRFAISRKREYMADAGAVQLTKNPQAMMRALQRIAGRDVIPETTGDIAMMCIENHKPFIGLFATHPPIAKRIEALSQVTRTPIPSISIPPAPKDQRFQQERPHNPWLSRQRGSRKNR